MGKNSTQYTVKCSAHGKSCLIYRTFMFTATTTAPFFNLDSIRILGPHVLWQEKRKIYYIEAFEVASL